MRNESHTASITTAADSKMRPADVAAHAIAGRFEVRLGEVL
jgi:hypothetical protein